ncbi:hypothetical protein KHP62_02395 [Rhodobacteraceae bacterium NNCM2]|nr:hypothetical protein [Coraliihabitans acroporae]
MTIGNSFSTLMLAAVFAVASGVSAGAGNTSIKCWFSSVADRSGIAETDFRVEFLIDFDSDKAYIIGNAGSSEVYYRHKEGVVSFVELLGSGAVTTTTILLGPPGMAVHSRNLVIGSEVVASQLYGRCRSF